MSARIEFTMGLKTHEAAAVDNDHRGFRIYILGNFSGQSNTSWERRKIRRIDVDNFNQVMADIAPALEVGTAASLEFDSTEDFHPDVWLKKVPILADLLQLKKDLADPNTAAQAAAKIQAFLPGQVANANDQPLERPESDEDTLERLLGRRPEPSVAKTGILDSIIRQAVSPHIHPDITLQHRDLIRVIEAALGEFMRSLLHDPDFQALEAIWLATESLVKEEGGDEQALFLVDISQAELMAECQNAEQALQQRLSDHIRSAESDQDVLLIGADRFSDTAKGLELLAYFGRLAKACGAYFLTAADWDTVESIQKRRYAEPIAVEHVVLSYPRYLVRLPYGSKRDPIETLAFEECSEVPMSEELPWGNPAFLCVRALIRSRAGLNWEQAVFFDDVPAFSFEQDGEQVMQPATEIVLNEAQANALAASGITPLIGFRQRRGLRLLPIRTLAERQ